MGLDKNFYYWYVFSSCQREWSTFRIRFHHLPPITEPLQEIALFPHGGKPSRLPFGSGERGVNVTSQKQWALGSEKDLQAQGIRCSRVMMAGIEVDFKRENIMYIFLDNIFVRLPHIFKNESKCLVTFCD